MPMILLAGDWIITLGMNQKLKKMTFAIKELKTGVWELQGIKIRTGNPLQVSPRVLKNIIDCNFFPLEVFQWRG